MPAKYTADEMAQITNATYRGGEYFMKCPAHADTQASLSFRDDPRTGNVLLTCHAGCGNSEVIKELAAMGLWESGPATSKSIFYPYNDENGNEIYRVLRYHDKSFPVGRMVGGEFQKGLGDQEPILYRLDELKRAKLTEHVFVTEGEKDADTAHRLGLVATTNFNGGSPDKWRDSYSGHLQGRKIVLLEDNDSMGVRRVTELKKRLVSIALSVDTITFRDMHKGADLTDWVVEQEAKGKKPIEIKHLLLSMLPQGDALGVLAQFKSKSLSQIIASMDNHADVTWVLPGSLPANEAFGLVGDPGVGKSTIALALGNEFLKLRESKGQRRGKILYLLLEGNTRNICSAALDLAMNPDDIILLENDNGSTRFDLADKKERDGAIKQILDYEQELGVALVIYDSFSATSSGLSINDPRIGTVMQELNSVLDRPGIPIVYINHCKKGQQTDDRAVNISLGSGTFLGQVRTAFLIKSDAKLQFVRKLILMKSNRIAAPDPERDFYFLKHGSRANFVSAQEYIKYTAAENENSADAATTMKAKAKRLVAELFLQDGRDKIPSNEIMDFAEQEGVSRKVMTETMAEMGVKSIKFGECWYREWPMRKLFSKTSSGLEAVLPDRDTPNQEHVVTEQPETVMDCAAGSLTSQTEIVETLPSTVGVAVAEKPDIQMIPDELMIKRAGNRIFRCFFIGEEFGRNDADSMVIRVRNGMHFYSFELKGETVLNFRETSKYSNGDDPRIHYLMSGTAVYLLTENEITRPDQASISNPMVCTRVWPRIMD